MARIPRIIALYSSRPQQGKSTVAAHLIDKYDYRLVKFADPLKRMVASLLRSYGIVNTHACLDGADKETVVPGLGLSTRDLLISLGTDWGRNMVRQDIWTLIAGRTIERHLRDDRRVVIDDMRFPNEYELLEWYATIGIPVSFVEVVCLTTTERGDASTEGLLADYPFYYTISANRGNLSGLRKEVDDMLQLGPRI